MEVSDHDDDDRRHGHRRLADTHKEHSYLRLSVALKSAALGYMLLFIGLTIGVWRLEHNDEARLRRAQVAECHRVNVLRGQSNENDRVVWAALYASYLREKALAERETPKSIHNESANATVKLLALMHRTAQTDCLLAVDHPATYDPPRPVSFNPKKDLRGLDFLVKLTKKARR